MKIGVGYHERAKGVDDSTLVAVALDAFVLPHAQMLDSPPVRLDVQYSMRRPMLMPMGVECVRMNRHQMVVTVAVDENCVLAYHCQLVQVPWQITVNHSHSNVYR